MDLTKKRRLFWVSIGEFIKNVQLCATSSTFTNKEKEKIESKIKEIKTFIETSELNEEVMMYIIKLSSFISWIFATWQGKLVFQLS